MGSTRSGRVGTPYSSALCSENAGVPTAASISAVARTASASRPSQSSTTDPGRSEPPGPATASRTGAGSTAS